jgi:hypothetical protein
MYATIHADRFFRQAAALEEREPLANISVEQKPTVNGSFELVERYSGRNVRFVLTGETATVTYRHGRCSPKVRTESREAARATYAKLLKAGYERF